MTGPYLMDKSSLQKCSANHPFTKISLKIKVLSNLTIECSPILQWPLLDTLLFSKDL